MLCPLTTELRCVCVRVRACVRACVRAHVYMQYHQPSLLQLPSSCPHSRCSLPSMQDYVCLSNYPVLIISYEMFVRTYEVVTSMTFDLIVCDEGHRLKNTTIKTTSVRAYSLTHLTLTLHIMHCAAKCVLHKMWMCSSCLWG